MQEKKKQQEDSNFWLDINLFKQNGKIIKEVEQKLSTIKRIETETADIEFLLDILKIEEDNKSYEDLISKINSFKTFIEEETITLLLNGEYDSCNAILSLHAGAGGTEAQDWANMLFRMYSMFCEKNGYKLSVIDSLDGDEAGLKSITFLVEGEKSYGYLKTERGVHRLVRISPFDANKRRHTSFASLEVMPEIDESIDVQINMDEVRVDTYRSSGAGGQHINKTDSAIRLTHLPTGIVVTCQNERSQIQNREMAFKVLRSKLIALKEEEREKNLKDIKGELKKIEWGSQIRSYVFCPYTMVKDHRTNFETANVDAVMNGELKPFILNYLKKSL